MEQGHNLITRYFAARLSVLGAYRTLSRGQAVWLDRRPARAYRTLINRNNLPCEAIILHVQTLAIRERVLGPGHPDQL